MRSGASVSLAVASYKVSARAFTLANAQPNVSQTNKNVAYGSDTLPSGMSTHTTRSTAIVRSTT